MIQTLKELLLISDLPCGKEDEIYVVALMTREVPEGLSVVKFTIGKYAMDGETVMVLAPKRWEVVSKNMYYEIHVVPGDIGEAPAYCYKDFLDKNLLASLQSVSWSDLFKKAYNEGVSTAMLTPEDNSSKDWGKAWLESNTYEILRERGFAR